MRSILTALCSTLGTLGNLCAVPADFPIVAEDLAVSLFARDPIVRNPCSLTFDSQGRPCVGMGPQYRSPDPDTEPDSVWILKDQDKDGLVDARHKFATGFNSIQGLAWKGDWLWIANAPDLTRVRDTDGDDVADEYVRVYTDLGNLEHGLHGLNFGPDGRLYMSKGNSKGLSIIPDRLAPRSFRELWGIEVPPGTPEPQPTIFTAASYQKNYQNPRDDWGVTGGILRCNDDGSNLEIISRGFRNPWDIAFDNRFDWLGTDNDQTMGDKIFTPFFGSHFGWGHPWSYDWKGDGHLPTAPSSGPLFEGSGAGVIHCAIPGYPNNYNNVFFINDWLNREIFIYRSRWDGAWRKPDRLQLEVLAHAGGGRSMPLSKGRSFDPVDIEMGPDGAIWITSWGRQYGAHYENNKLANEGRIYRLWPRNYSPSYPSRDTLTVEGLIADLGSHLPAWRTNAQEELIRRGKSVESSLRAALRKPDLSVALETWLVWTIGRINPDGWFEENTNRKVQSIRVATFNGRLHPAIQQALSDKEPKVRLAAVIALRELRSSDSTAALLNLAARESDRIVYYAAWGALMDLLPENQRKTLLGDRRASIRLAALLGLLEEDALSKKEIETYTKDQNTAIADLSARRLGGKHQFEHRGRPLAATGQVQPPEPLAIPFSNVRASSGHAYRAATLHRGAACYTDRSYLLTRIPPELEGLTFLQTACADAESESGITVSLNLKYPSTVYLIDDARAESMPRWARSQWKSTSLVIEGNDPKRMKVYRAELPSGPLSLGASRDGIKARKGNYIIAVQPHILAPDGKVATVESVLPLLEGANLERGQDLFFSMHGANCASCHQVKGRGKNHAPDLSEIGSRASARMLLESILNPSASIVEGFAAQFISTHSGESYTGVVLKETGKRITMAMLGGTTSEIERADILSRESLSISAMPPGFGAIMNRQQLADLTAWLMNLKKPETITDNEEKFKFREEGAQLHLQLGKTQIATYILAHEQLTRRAFVNMRTPSGIQVTRNFPARRPDDLDPSSRDAERIIHPLMHPGLWMSFGWIDGNDYWRLTSKVKFEKYLERPTSSGREASFSTRDRYLNREGTGTVCLQDTSYRFRRIPAGIEITWKATFYNDDRDFLFGDQEESGLALRIASPLRVKGGNGRILNNRGEENGTGTWGRNFRWIDYSGVVKGKRAGIMVIPHPENSRRSWSHSRDYGLLASNPFQKQPDERREPYITTNVKKGQKFKLAYTIVLHESGVESFDSQKIIDSIQEPRP